MKKTNIIIVTVQVLLVAALAWIYIGKEKMAYVEISEVYSGFELKKELTAQFEEVKNARQYLLDSLKSNLDISYKQLQGKDSEELMRSFEQKRQEYLYKQQRFEEDTQRLLENYEEQIWTQLNQYVKEFGKYYSYDYVYGANGTGSMMYANDANNVSKELLNYVNEKYHGKVQ